MSKQWHGGKGSKSRTTNSDAYASNYDKIFNPKHYTERCNICGGTGIIDGFGGNGKTSCHKCDPPPPKPAKPPKPSQPKGRSKFIKKNHFTTPLKDSFRTHY